MRIKYKKISDKEVSYGIKSGILLSIVKSKN